MVNDPLEGVVRVHPVGGTTRSTYVPAGKARNVKFPDASVSTLGSVESSTPSLSVSM